jgi:hypothetical protein
MRIRWYGLLPSDSRLAKGGIDNAYNQGARLLTGGIALVTAAALRAFRNDAWRGALPRAAKA